MVRPRKTQTPQTPGLEAGAAYGEVSDSLEAQAAIPLKEGGGIATPPQANVPAVQAPVQPGPLPLEAAAGYTPQVTPLTAPGTGMARGVSRLAPTPNEDAAQMLRNWAEAVNEPALIDAAIQLGQ
jgi:hypothetical protein